MCILQSCTAERWPAVQRTEATACQYPAGFAQNGCLFHKATAGWQLRYGWARCNLWIRCPSLVLRFAHWYECIIGAIEHLSYGRLLNAQPELGDRHA